MPTGLQRSEEHAVPLAGIVGAEHLTTVESPFSPGSVLRAAPADEAQTAAVLRHANDAGLKVAPAGGGTKLDWGTPPARIDLLLSTARMNRVVEHAWADMTATAEAGCTVETLQRALAGHGQRLALDPLFPGRATLGGVLATNDSGSLRHRFGSLRDLVIGITVALPDGTLARGGGKVVKNVAGYDLQKLMIGALGTLAVVTRVVLRLHPLPKHERTATFAFDGVGGAVGFMLALTGTQAEPTGLQLRTAERHVEVDVRFENLPESAEAQMVQARSLASAALPKREAEASVWRARERLYGDSGGGAVAAVVKASVLPSQLATLCTMAEAAARGRRARLSLVAQAQGLATVRIEATHEDDVAHVIRSARAAAERDGGSLVVQQAPASLRRAIDVWGDAGGRLPLLRAIKQQFDPAGTLNPGRFVGGL